MSVKQSVEFFILAAIILALPANYFGTSINELGKDLGHKLEMKQNVK